MQGQASTQSSAAVEAGNRSPGPARTGTSAFPPGTLITFPPSLDSELSRFLLAHYRVPHVEARHTILFSSIFTYIHAHSKHFPTFYGDGYQPMDNVQKMIDHFDPLVPEERRLLPTGSDRAQVDADWDQFRMKMGGGTTQFAYYHLLPLRDIMVTPLSEGTPWFEALAVRWFYPVFAGALSKGLKLSEASAQQGLDDIRTIVKAVDERLADGRRYLVGGRFTLSDMSFANALSPLVLPPEYGGAIPTFAQMPPVLQSVIEEMRARPAGQFALRIYHDHRRGG